VITLRYRSGEEIRKGDRVRFHGNEAEIEWLAVRADDPEWHVSEFGSGVMLSDAASGRTFIPSEQLADYEDLGFVARAE
jgi:hypothetical protein